MRSAGNKGYQRKIGLRGECKSRKSALCYQIACARWSISQEQQADFQLVETYATSRSEGAIDCTVVVFQHQHHLVTVFAPCYCTHHQTESTCFPMAGQQRRLGRTCWARILVCRGLENLMSEVRFAHGLEEGEKIEMQNTRGSSDTRKKQAHAF